MKKTNAFLLIIFAALFGACYKSGSTNKVKTTSANPASPVVENSVAPVNQANDGDAQIYGKAVAELEAAVKKDPKNQQAYFQLGKSYQALKVEGKAVGAYQKSIEIKPD